MATTPVKQPWELGPVAKPGTSSNPQGGFGNFGQAPGVAPTATTRPGVVSALPPPAPPPPNPLLTPSDSGSQLAGTIGAGMASAPTAAAGALGAVGSGFLAPGESTGYWQGVAGQFNGGGPMVSNNAQGAYDSYMKSMPDINPDANLGAYYDNARTRQTQDMNRELGSRGAYNSSAALDQIAQGNATLNAQQAKDEGQYGLDRASTLGNLAAIGGNLASGADTSSRSSADSKLGYLRTGGELAHTSTQDELARVTGAVDAGATVDRVEIEKLRTAADIALSGQREHNDIGQNAFKNAIDLGAKTAGVAQQAYQDILDGDKELLDAVLSGNVAALTDKYNMTVADANKFMSDMKSAAELLTSGKK